MTAITIRNFTKTFGDTVAVDAIDLDIEASKLFFLLGPSGCGKTTLLRMIAGFIAPDSGTIAFDGRDVTHTPPNRRNTGMVFQNYALWPHMTVFDNVAYGLGVRKIPRGEKSERTLAALRMVQMQDYRGRRPNQLSGGQQQRVALARALVIEPSVLLLDEPLSNLDARLRLEMREQIRRICDATGITTVYVTHDQKEALSLADSIAVMRAGRVVQQGSPRGLYARPRSRFVADFLGETNFLNAKIISAENGVVMLETPAGTMRSTAFDEHTPERGNVTCSIRPETLRLLDAPVPAGGANHNTLSGKLVQSVFLGEMAQHTVELADGTMLKVFEIAPRTRDAGADSVTLRVADADIVLLPD